MTMRIILTDTDRDTLAEWLADLAWGREPEAVDALADGRHARVTRDEDGSLVYRGRVLLVLPDGVQDVAVSVRQGLVSTRPWRLPEAATLPLPDAPTPTLPERTTTP